MNMILWKQTSTNGRWGVTIVGPEEDDIWPKQGKLFYLGEAGGYKTFRFEPSTEVQQWVLPAADAVVVEGASIAVSMDLQSNNSATILLLSEAAVVRLYGYKRRSESEFLYLKGQRVSMPPELMLANGYIKGTVEQEVDAPPAMSNAMQEALKRAGLK